MTERPPVSDAPIAMIPIHPEMLNLPAEYLKQRLILLMDQATKK
jgi:hypothetical protein